MMINDVVDRQDRPAYVRFERVPVEDRPASVAAGHYVAKDVDYACITPPYSKDVMKFKIATWMENLDQEERNGRVPKAWVDNYKAAYRAWQNGQELPLTGTPIKGWGVLSPAQSETLIRMNVLTVEDLAAMNEEGLTRIGMGAVELRAKAKAWLSQLHDKGPLTMEVTALQARNAQLETTIAALTRQVDMLVAQARQRQEGVPMEAPTDAPFEEPVSAMPAEAPMVRVPRKYTKRVKPEMVLEG